MTSTDVSQSIGPISIRESEILQLLSFGYTSRQIADMLFISELTVQTHRRNMLKKLGFNNSAQLIRWGFLNGTVISQSTSHPISNQN